MSPNDRFRVRILTALGLGLVACEAKEPAAPAVPVVAPATAAPTTTATTTPSSEVAPPATAAAPEAEPPVPGRGVDHSPTCMPVEKDAAKPRSAAFADCAATVEGKCCGPAGGSKTCQKALLEDATRSQRAKGGPPSCCYPPDTSGCRGRPLRPDADAPPIVARSLRTASFDVARDRRAGERWLRDAASEHASIASFAITSLELVALGAPLDLVAETHRAAADEVEHTRISLEIASALLGERHAMGPLAVPAFEPASCTFAAVARATFRDAACSETVAAMRAREESEREADPLVRAALVRIAEDEARHAELGWRTVAWLLEAGGQAAREAVREELERTRTKGHGDRILSEVVLPCADALLAAS